MNKTTLISTLIIALVAIIGITAFANIQSSQNNTKKAEETAMMKKKDDDAKMAMKKSEEDAMMKKDSSACVAQEATDLAMAKKETDPAMMQKKTDEAMAMIKKCEEGLVTKKDTMIKDDAMMKKDSPTSTNTPVTVNTEVMKKEVGYLDYSADKIANASNGNVVLFFKANWCPSCKSLDEDITKNISKISSNLTLLKVRYDDASGASKEELELKKKYGVTTQHTLVKVDKDGNLIKKTSGSPTLQSVEDFAKS